MPITVLSDIILPPTVIIAGLQGSNVRSNTRAMNQGGFGQINVNWTRTLRQYQLGFVAMLPSEWTFIEGLHEVTEGGAFGFLLLDPKDQKCTAAQGRLVGTPGTAGPYRLDKRYSSVGTTRFKDRTITRPVPAGLLCFVNGTSRAYTLNTTTGAITFTVAPITTDVLTWSGTFHVPVHFLEDSLPWELVRSGQADTRLIMGSSITLQEVRE